MSVSGPVRLPGRQVISVGGSHRVRFLEGLITCRVDDMSPGDLRHGALLTPQGKIITDMMVFAYDDLLQLDVPGAAADDLIKRLTVYRLRAAVTFELTEEAAALVPDGEGAADPRSPGLGARAILGEAAADDAALTAHRTALIEAGVAEAGRDYPFAAHFPHDVNLDVTGGVDFTKGCFVGQEVVSRMRHRGTARRRTVIVSGEAPLPDPGTPITVGEASVGIMGDSTGGAGLAIVRIDKAGETAMADDVPVRLTVPPRAPFNLTGTGAAEDSGTPAPAA